MAHTFKRTELTIYTTVSEQLKQARLDKHLTLADCAGRLGIQEKYLSAIEASHYASLPGEMYAKAWVKKYANLLEVPLQDLLISYDKENSIRAKLEQKNGVRRAPLLPRLATLITGKRIAFAVVFILILSYTGFVINASISPPKVTFDTPLKDFRTQENRIILKGRTEPGVTVTVNMQPVILDSSNAFSQEIGLRDGLNTIRIEAKKKHSRSFVKEVTIVKIALPDTIPTQATSTATTTGPK